MDHQRFGLNDAIESGLVKTPRVVVRDDAKLGKNFKSRLYHIYADPTVKDDINQKVEPHVPLPDLVNTAYHDSRKRLGTRPGGSGNRRAPPPLR